MIDAQHAKRELWWYLNVALPGSDVGSVDMRDVPLGLAGWQCVDPNIEMVARARPIRQALARCTSRQRMILVLALSEQTWRYAPWRRAGAVAAEARRPNTERFRRLAELCETYGEQLAPLVWHYRPEGDVGRQRVWAESTLRAALVAFARVYE